MFTRTKASRTCPTFAEAEPIALATIDLHFVSFERGDAVLLKKSKTALEIKTTKEIKCVDANKFGICATAVYQKLCSKYPTVRGRYIRHLGSVRFNCRDMNGVFFERRLRGMNFRIRDKLEKKVKAFEEESENESESENDNESDIKSETKKENKPSKVGSQQARRGQKKIEDENGNKSEIKQSHEIESLVVGIENEEKQKTSANQNEILKQVEHGNEKSDLNVTVYLSESVTTSRMLNETKKVQNKIKSGDASESISDHEDESENEDGNENEIESDNEKRK